MFVVYCYCGTRIADRGNDREDHSYSRKNGNYDNGSFQVCIHKIEEERYNKHREKQTGCKFTVPFGCYDCVCFMIKNRAAYEHKEIFCDHNAEKPPTHSTVYTKTGNRGNLEKFIRNRVKNLADSGNKIEFSCYHTVKDIGDARQHEYYKRCPAKIGRKI